MELEGRVALVTGGARRVGRVIALELARRGAHVIIHYHRSEEEALHTVEELLSLGVHAGRTQGDLADPLDVEKIFVAAEALSGRVDVLINNASTFQAREILELSPKEWDQVMAVNLRGPFLCSQRAAHLMLAHGQGGAIVNIADVAGLIPWTRYPHHSVAKAGLIMLTKVLAKALAPHIRVNAVVPGPILAPEGIAPERWERLGEVLPMGHTGSPENLAQTVITLIENDFMTGAILNVDGGDTLLGSLDML